jgi:hypothetical protein
VSQESATGIEPNNYILAAAIDSHDSLPLKLGGDFEGIDGTRQARVEDLDVFEAAPEEHGFEPAADGLDLW